MIKLFWNTHNQKKSITEDKNIKSKEAVNFKWGIYHQKNSNIWISEILKKIKYTIINSENELEKEDILLIVDSSPEEKVELFVIGKPKQMNNSDSESEILIIEFKSFIMNLK